MTNHERLSDLEIWHVARILVQKHGDHATEEAEKFLVGAIARGDAEGDEAWRRVLNVISKLQNTKPERAVN